MADTTAIWSLIFIIGLSLIVLLFLAGMRWIRQTHRGLVERMGKFQRFAEPGFNWIIPIIDNMTYVEITEQIADAEPQQIITKDKLNAQVDAQVYFKVKPDSDSVYASQYNVHDYHYQIVSLARTTLRNIIGTMSLVQANSERDNINNELLTTLKKETKSWGIDIVRTELKEIDPPKDVQDVMNKVVKAENEKIAAVDFATAAETTADGIKRAKIKEAEGQKQFSILIADGEAQAVRLKAQAKADAIKMVNESAAKYFKGDAQKLKQLEVTQASLENNSKVIMTEKGIKPNILIGNLIEK